MRVIDDAGPLAKHFYAAERRDEFDQPGRHRLGRRHIAALRIRGIGIGIAAQHQPALVRLADINAQHRRGHDDIEHRLQRFGHERLERITAQGQPEPGHIGQHRRVPGDRHPQLAAGNIPLRRAHARHRAAGGVTLDPGHAAILDHIDAHPVGSARKAPHHGIVPHRTRAPLHHAAEDRIARLRPEI